MNATTTSSVVDLEPFTNFSPIFAYLIGQLHRRAPRLLERPIVVNAFLALYVSKIEAFIGDVDSLLRDSSRTTILSCLDLVRQIAYPTYEAGIEGTAQSTLCVVRPVWQHVDLALRHILMVPQKAHVLRVLRLRLRYAWDVRVAIDDQLTPDHLDAGEPFEFVAALARFVLVLNRRAS